MSGRAAATDDGETADEPALYEAVLVKAHGETSIHPPHVLNPPGEVLLELPLPGVESLLIAWTDCIRDVMRPIVHHTTSGAAPQAWRGSVLATEAVSFASQCIGRALLR